MERNNDIPKLNWETGDDSFSKVHLRYFVSFPC